MIESLLFIGAGLGLGVISGLFPGIHLNTISSLVLFFQFHGSLSIVLLIVAMNSMHSFVDFIPSILVGAPSETNFLSALPGHRLFLKGKALQGIQLTVLGNLGGILGSMALLPIYWLFAEQTRGFLYQTIPWILLGMMVLLVHSEKKNRNKIVALLVIALSGSLGVMGLRSGSSQLFPLVTGFFGLSTLLYSLREKERLVHQETRPFKMKIAGKIRTLFLGSACGSLVSLFPTLSTSQAAFICQGIQPKFSTKQFLVLLGAINASATVFSFVALQVLGKARSGSAVAIQQLYSFSPPEFAVVLATIVFSAGISAFFTLGLARKAVGFLQKISYQKLNLGIILLLCALTLAISGLAGMGFLFLSTCIGLVPHLQGTKKIHCMAFLMVPTILFYLGI